MTYKILLGDCLERLKQMETQSVNCIITSPPYYGLRDYGNDLQIGLEETPEDFIKKLTSVFHECKRVLKDDGTLWLNIGDSYAGTGDKRDFKDPKYADGRNGQSVSLTKKVVGCKGKDLIGIPWMLAFALRSDGWYLRQDIIWHKPNPMPEPVKDRCTKSHEYIFLLSKKPRYYFDYKAIQEPIKETAAKRLSQDIKSQNGSYEPSKCNVNMKSVGKYKSAEQEASVRQGMNHNRGNNIVVLRKGLPKQKSFVDFLRSRTTVDKICQETGLKKSMVEHWFRYDESGFCYPSVEDWNKIRWIVDDWSVEFAVIDAKMTEVTIETDEIGKNSNGMRNKRDVWSVTTKPFKGAHFATFPEDLIEPCVLAGSPVGGVVLDPFCGSGTTGVVAVRNEREFIGIELNKDYLDMAEKRIGKEEKQGIQISLF